jgi:8-oxo-dGTP diphosphatase
MRETRVVTAFLLRHEPGSRDEVLLLRRSGRVGTYQGRWAGISGYLEEQSPLAQAYTELREETGLRPDEVVLLSEGEPLEAIDEELGRRWVIYPFLFQLRPLASVHLDWEHVEARWVYPDEVGHYQTVPRLADTLARVYPPRGESNRS